MLNIQPSGHNQFPEIANSATGKMRTNTKVRNNWILDVCWFSMGGSFSHCDAINALLEFSG
jgi:hypothetical protein